MAGSPSIIWLTGENSILLDRGSMCVRLSITGSPTPELAATVRDLRFKSWEHKESVRKHTHAYRGITRVYRVTRSPDRISQNSINLLAAFIFSARFYTLQLVLQCCRFMQYIFCWYTSIVKIILSFNGTFFGIMKHPMFVATFPRKRFILQNFQKIYYS